MKKRNLILGVMLIMLLALSTGLMADGTEPSGNPRQVSTLDHLLWISTNSSSWDDNFIQTADIDASGTSSWNSGSGFSPIGIDYNNDFTGEYNGQGHTIDLLFIDRPGADYIGLFGYTYESEIDSVGVTNVDITGDNYVGGLIGYNRSSTVSNSYSTGSVTGGEWSVGGLVGYNRSSTVSNSYSTGSVSGSSYSGAVGGLVGYNNNNSTVSNSYSTGSVSGDSSVGGLVGANEDSSTVSNSYSMSSVSSGDDCAGGLVGYNELSTVSNSYSMGSVSGNDYVGGLVGDNSYSTVSNSFWDTETSGQSSSDGGTGKTTAEMKDYNTFTDTTNSAGLSTAWDFVNNPNDDANNNDYWGINGIDNEGYPFLMWQGYLVALDAPQNLQITITDSNIELTWDSVANATGYKVFSSTDPQTSFTEDTSGTFIGASWNALIGDVKKFYYVKALNLVICQ